MSRLAEAGRRSSSSRVRGRDERTGQLTKRQERIKRRSQKIAKKRQQRMKTPRPVVRTPRKQPQAQIKNTISVPCTPLSQGTRHLNPDEERNVWARRFVDDEDVRSPATRRLSLGDESSEDEEAAMERQRRIELKQRQFLVEQIADEAQVCRSSASLFFTQSNVVGPARGRSNISVVFALDRAPIDRALCFSQPEQF
jgi:hypothetical protein